MFVSFEIILAKNEKCTLGRFAFLSLWKSNLCVCPFIHAKFLQLRSAMLLSLEGSFLPNISFTEKKQSLKTF